MVSINRRSEFVPIPTASRVSRSSTQETPHPVAGPAQTPPAPPEAALTPSPSNPPPIRTMRVYTQDPSNSQVFDISQVPTEGQQRLEADRRAHEIISPARLIAEFPGAAQIEDRGEGAGYTSTSVGCVEYRYTDGRTTRLQMCRPTETGIAADNIGFPSVVTPAGYTPAPGTQCFDYENGTRMCRFEPVRPSDPDNTHVPAALSNFVAGAQNPTQQANPQPPTPPPVDYDSMWRNLPEHAPRSSSSHRSHRH